MSTTTKTVGACMKLVRANLREVGAGGTDETGYRMGWRKSHVRAWQSSGFGRMVEGLALIADEHAAECGSGIGQDGVLGQEWIAAASAAVGMLNGVTGGIDCGTVDGLIRRLALVAEFSAEEADALEWNI